MKNLVKFLSLIVVVFTVSCGKTDVNPEPPIQNENIIISQNITTSTTWTSDKVYQLSGRISVTEGAVLTIEPGTIIKGQEGTGANASALVISKNSKIIAEGTAESPIIFTAVADQITPEDVKNGVFESPNLNETISGLWGGLIVLGNAPVSASNDQGNVSQVQIEGIPTSDQNGLYGGDNPHDYSGILKYISIRHGGANIGSGNEINGLTLGGVGDSTIIENIEVIANQDDGIEWFGGTVNVKNLVVWNVGDDAIDTDQSWGGSLENFVIITAQGHCFELDGPEGTMINTHTIRDGFVYTTSDLFTSMDLINTDDNSFVNLENIFFTDISEGQKINRVSHDIGSVTFTNITLNVDPSQLLNHVNGPVPQGVVAGNTSFVSLTDFDWSLAYHKGLFN